MAGSNGRAEFQANESYDVQIVSAQALTSRAKGTPYLEIKFQSLDGDTQGDTIVYEMYSTAGRRDATKRELAVFGFDAGPEADWAGLPDFLVGKECRISLKSETYNEKERLKVDYIKAKGQKSVAGGALGEFAAVFDGIVTPEGQQAAKKRADDRTPF